MEKKSVLYYKQVSFPTDHLLLVNMKDASTTERYRKRYHTGSRKQAQSEVVWLQLWVRGQEHEHAQLCGFEYQRGYCHRAMGKKEMEKAH